MSMPLQKNQAMFLCASMKHIAEQRIMSLMGMMNIRNSNKYIILYNIIVSHIIYYAEVV